jgi:peptidoglycan/LPS O-acetylase OafA/YrhL
VTTVTRRLTSGAARSDGGADVTPGHLPSLDGIRAVAFLIVFLAHAGLEGAVPGGFGVTIFFFLSGYLITTLLRKEFEATGSISLRQFYLRRALRILPPFYLVLAFAILAARSGLIPGGFRGDAVLAQALQLANYRIASNGYGGLPAGTGVYWSLAVEEHFYLVFPVFYLALRRRGLSARAQAMTLWVLCALTLAWRCVLVWTLHASAERTFVATDTRVDSILFGCALAVYGNPALDGAGHLSERLTKRTLLPASLVLLCFTFLYRDSVFRETFRYTLQGVALYIPMVVALRFPTWAPVRWLNSPPVAFAGVLSYSLYLVHHVLLNVVGSHLGGSSLLRGCVGLGASALFAWAVYRLVERPCALLRKRLSPLVGSEVLSRARARQAVAA